MSRLLYSLLFYLLLPVVVGRLLWRSLKAPAYRGRWAERFGFYRRQEIQQRPLWVHAVSVGETIAIAPLVKLWLQRHPDVPVIMTTMTPTGSAQVRKLFGDSVTHVYCPYDLPDALARFHRRFQPQSCVVVETELWPNLVASCHRRNVPVLLANARLSERSARGYQRFRSLATPMLNQLSKIAAQDCATAERFIRLGMNASKVTVTGSIKFDIEPPVNVEQNAQALRDRWGAQRPVWVAGSTHAGEDELILDVFQRLKQNTPELLLVIVPRHPERFSDVAALAESTGLEVCRRSTADPSSATDIYLGDTMGELMLMFAAADVAFVGGSLIERGGHNPLEPGVLAKPVVMGEHIFNFAQICQQLQENEGLRLVSGAEELYQVMEHLLQNSSAAAEMGAKAANFIAANRGALEKLYQQVDQLSERESEIS